MSAQKLVSLANERGGKDNTTIQVIDIVKGNRLPGKMILKAKNNKIKLVISVLMIALFTTIIFRRIYIHPGEKKEVKNSFVNRDSSNKTIVSDSIQKSNKIVMHKTADSGKIKVTNPINENVGSKKNVAKVNEVIKTKRIIYKIKEKETLTSIAQKYKCSVKDLEQWNGLNGLEKLKIGSELIIKQFIKKH